MANFREGDIIRNDEQTITNNTLIFCHTGHLRITTTQFHDEILCAGEIIFLPRQSEYCGVALSNSVLVIHRFHYKSCFPEHSILSHLNTPCHVHSKTYCCKLAVAPSLHTLLESISFHITERKGDHQLWQIKHDELIWVFIRYYSHEELYAFFYPMANEKTPFKSLVLTHYRRAEYTDSLARMCGYGLHAFRKIFKQEFGISPYKWLNMKRAEHIRYRLSLPYIPFCDIIDEFNFSSAQQFSRFCSTNMGDSPSNLRKQYIKEAYNVCPSH